MKEIRRWSFIYGWPSFRREESAAMKSPVLAVTVTYNLNRRKEIAG